MALKCSLCGKKTMVKWTRAVGLHKVKRLRVCSDASCDSSPFWTIEEKYKRKINYPKSGNEND